MWEWQIKGELCILATGTCIIMVQAHVRGCHLHQGLLCHRVRKSCNPPKHLLEHRSTYSSVELSELMDTKRDSHSTVSIFGPQWNHHCSHNGSANPPPSCQFVLYLISALSDSFPWASKSATVTSKIGK